jgi:hypothetical protein
VCKCVLYCTVLYSTVLHCTVLLPPGVNPIAVNKYIKINININIFFINLYCEHIVLRVNNKHRHIRGLTRPHCCSSTRHSDTVCVTVKDWTKCWLIRWCRVSHSDGNFESYRHSIFKYTTTNSCQLISIHTSRPFSPASRRHRPVTSAAYATSQII